MNLRDDNTGDSLWLLLDTICNAFGGMLLIAILFALFSSQARVVENAGRVTTLNTELQERRIALAQHDLELAQQLNAQQQALLANVDLAARVRLVAQRDALRADADALHANATRLNTSLIEVGSVTQQSSEERLKELRDQLDIEKRAKTDQANNLSAASQNLQRLLVRLADLQNQANAERQAHTVKLRLPRESAQSKASFAVMIRYGRLYFVHDPSNSFNRNTYALRFESQDDDDIKVTPIRGRGIDLHAAAKLLRAVSSQESYIVCWVYGDSFQTFNQFKQLVTNSGFEYGWSPMSPENFLTLTKRKVEAPPPL